MQDLHYTYDPAGNITHIADDAQQTIYLQQPAGRAELRLHLRRHLPADRSHRPRAPRPDRIRLDPPDGNLPRLSLCRVPTHAHPNDVQAMRNYTERYVYDAVGNFLQMQPPAAQCAASWTRGYAYDEPSLIEAGQEEQPPEPARPSAAAITVETYTYDAHGNMTAHAASAV